MQEITPTVSPEPSHEVRVHAKISPSKLNYLDPDVGGCLGFQQDSGTSEAAEEGTRRHEILDRAISDWVRDGRQVTLRSVLFTQRIREGWDDETEYAVQWCVGQLEPYLAKATRVLNEQKISITSSKGANTVTFGYYDLLLVFANGSGLLVDFKFGRVPVEPAPTNRQGLAYAVGAFQAHRDLQKIVVMFLQPAAGFCTTHTYTRAQYPQMQEQVERIVDNVEVFRVWTSEMRPEEYVDALTPGTSCTYCNRFADCPAYLRSLKVAARAAQSPLVLPDSFDLAAIDTPEKAAVAAYWVDFLTDKLPEIKRRALEIAKENGGSISYTSGDHAIEYVVSQRKHDRVLGKAPEVMEAVKDLLAPEEVLAAAKLQLGALEGMLVSALQANAAGNGEKLSKKDAAAQATSLLEAHGVLSQPDGSIDVLRQNKQAKQKK